MIDDGNCNRKIEFKAKSEIMKMKSNYKRIDKKTWRVLKVKRFPLRNILYKV